MKTLDYYMRKWFYKDLIRYKDLDKSYMLIDVRTSREFKKDRISKVNIPVINEKEHDFLHKNKSIAGLVVLFGLLKRHKQIKKYLLKYKDNVLVFHCSKGRLRSPMVWIYGKFILGLDCMVLENGILSVKEVEHIQLY